MTPLSRRQQAALEPVSAAMLRRATAEAEAIIAAARRDAAALLAAARRDAEAALGQARADGLARAAPLAAAERSRGRRAARETLLAAEGGLRHETERRIRAAVLGLRDQPGYGELRDRLTALSRAAAGPGAVVSEHPAGGVVARAPGVFVDCSLPRLADRVIGDLSPQISELCTS
jgi:vacuolar-type H+-ATPase subunit E/Vma4